MESDPKDQRVAVIGLGKQPRTKMRPHGKVD